MRIGVQLYTLREPMDRDLAGTLGRLGEAGLRWVETAGTHGRSAGEYRAELDRAKLSAVGCHVGWDDLAQRLDQTVAMAKTLGAGWLVLPWIQTERFLATETFARDVSEVAAKVAAHGLQFAYHNHAFEFQEVDGRPAYGELDLYWAHHAGHDPADWLKRLKGRVPLTHYKDGHDGVFHPVGQGDLDWDRIVPASREAGVEYALIELDSSPKDPVECVLESREFLLKMGLSD
jgi:sugar phosphate isomerase/epimerase